MQHNTTYLFRKFSFHFSCLAVGFGLLLSSGKVAAQEETTTRILFIFDASNSMNGVWEKNQKITVARNLLSQALDSLARVENLQMAMRAYGHEKNYLKGQDCDDTKLLVPFGNNTSYRIKSELAKLKPKGTTPIAATLEKSAGDFPPCDNCRNIIILITDGIEECGGDPCAVSKALRSRDIILKPFVIGIGLDVEFRETFECVGSFYDAANESSFKNALNVVISQALNSTTSQINLLDVNGAATETNVNMTLYDHHTGSILNNYVHTINNRGNPDTLFLDPVYAYDIQVHTIPSVWKDSATINAGTHTIIGIPAPQGDLEFKMQGRTPESDKIRVIVRQAGDQKTLHVQGFGEKQRYIVGKYDLEILTLPRTYISDVDVSQSHTTTIEIPQPGVVTFSKIGYGYGSVYLMKNSRLELVTVLSETKERETLSLQPGSYKVVYRPKQARQSVFTIEKNFKVVSGSSVAVKIN